MLVGAEYAAYMILIIYIGAIMVLFLFVIMLLDIRKLEIIKTIFKTWVLYFGSVIILEIIFLGDLVLRAIKDGIELAQKYFGNNFNEFYLSKLPNEEMIGAGLFNVYNPIYVCLIIYLVIALFLIFYIVKQAYRIPRTLEEFRGEQVKTNKKLKGDWKSFRKDIQSIINKFNNKRGGKKGKGKL